MPCWFKYVYDLDKLEYSPLNENYANALLKAKDIEIQTSMDGKSFKHVKELKSLSWWWKWLLLI